MTPGRRGPGGRVAGLTPRSPAPSANPPAAPSAAPGRWRTWLSLAAAALDAGALVASLLPFGGRSCSTAAVAVAVARGRLAPAAPPSETCHAVATIGAFQHAVPALAVMIALGLVPLLTLPMRRRWPSAASAAAQAVLQVLGFGAFTLWLPAWLLTIAAAAVPPAG